MIRLAAALLACLLTPLRAQETHETSRKNVVRLDRAPISGEVLRVRLPRPAEKRLGNGLAVLVLERRSLPKVELSLWIKTGALSDPKGLPGLAQFTAEMLREGTSRRSSAEIASEVEELGASLGGASGFGSDVSEVSASGLATDLEALLDLLSDVALRPSFSGPELAKYKLRKLSALEKERAEPEFLAREKFHQALYARFPASVVSATPDSVRRATREELRAFHDRHYLPQNAILGIAGDVKPEEAFALAEKYFGSWKSLPEERLDAGTVPAPTPSKVSLVDRPGSVQTDIIAGDIAIRRTDPDYIPLVVANRILGEGPSSRLFLVLREEKGFTYGAYSRLSPDIYPGPWQAETEARNAVVEGSLRELLGEFRRIRDEKVPPRELDEARRAIVARFALSLERPEVLLSRWMQVRYFGLPEDYWDRYTEEVSRVDAEAVQRVARRYLDLEHLQIVCVGDAKQILDSVKKYGPVEVFDAEGKRLY